MPQGLQVWDESGKLIVDLTDRQLTYFGSVTHTAVPVGQEGGKSFTGTFAGISKETTVGYLDEPQIATSTNRVGRQLGRTVVITGDNTYRISSYVVYGFPITIYFYKFV